MKNSLLKWYMLVFILASNFVVFAQGDPTQEGLPTDPELEAGDSPINGKLIWLAIVGIAFAYAYYVKLQKDKNAA
ncbi:hypothetical protein Q765_04805 [Flavobacterium rivuli WB 3.3-2 = DSM 21788]|uniref:Signal peptidase n=1 Tax=Flavobacterium rivuli WB 3.3-2 = DSM 21788 TaxID=1121895 RepID=A0A0A2M8P1_9FLAO|nr:hypothetical protein [Flavobacterium rivuli]KGO87813.1 hypothetical protein Q765_04805 [Flavobacterium rivuli WB 3.3-2 = DSM 21788]